MRDRPYFMNDPKWFEFDFNKRIYVLTNEAPEEAKESYQVYLKELQKD